MGPCGSFYSARFQLFAFFMGSFVHLEKPAPKHGHQSSRLVIVHPTHSALVAQICERQLLWEIPPPKGRTFANTIANHQQWMRCSYNPMCLLLWVVQASPALGQSETTLSWKQQGECEYDGLLTVVPWPSGSPSFLEGTAVFDTKHVASHQPTLNWSTAHSYKRESYPIAAF